MNFFLPLTFICKADLLAENSLSFAYLEIREQFPLLVLSVLTRIFLTTNSQKQRQSYKNRRKKMRKRREKERG
jgi:hypothetical protein